MAPQKRWNHPSLSSLGALSQVRQDRCDTIMHKLHWHHGVIYELGFFTKVPVMVVALALRIGEPAFYLTIDMLMSLRLNCRGLPGVESQFLSTAYALLLYPAEERTIGEKCQRGNMPYSLALHTYPAILRFGEAL